MDLFSNRSVQMAHFLSFFTQKKTLPHNLLSFSALHLIYIIYICGMKSKHFTFTLLLWACTAGLGAAGKNGVFTITNQTCQTIDGFGASDAWSMWQLGLWADSVQQQVADWLFSTENDQNGQPKGIGLSIWRFNAGAGSATQGDSAQINRDTRTEYYARQTGQRRFLQLAKQRGVPTFLAFFNTPPVQLTQNGLGTNTGRDGTRTFKDCGSS